MPGPNPGPRGIFRTILDAYSWLLSQLLVVTIVVLVVPVSLQIFSRYTDLIPSYIWTEEMARSLFVWSIMLGSMLGVREGTHFEVDVWPRLSPRPAAALRIVSRIGVLIVALVFLWGGIEFTQFAWNRISELAELPLWMIHIAWPMAGATWLLFAGEQMIDDIAVVMGWRPGPPDITPVDIEARTGGHE
jgi:TRAP-type C4-dicarboxylate transport system permease small subunit